MAVFIREATINDADTIYQFVSALQKKEFDKEAIYKIYNSNISNQDNLYLIAVDETQPIGYISCHSQWLLHHQGKVAEIQEMYVKPEYRSQGIGKMLMMDVKERSKALGAVQLEVTTRAIREGAIKFYKREEFQDSHKKLVYYF